MAFDVYDMADVERLLDYPGCIVAVREAMIGLATTSQSQPLRQVATLSNNGLFGVMPGEATALGTFGAKLVSVFGDPDRPGRTRHRGVVVAFDIATGAVSCLADAEAVTVIRTGCASAVATDALSRDDAKVLLILGTGAQAESHLRALSLVRPFKRILLWGRSFDAARAMAHEQCQRYGFPVEAVADVRESAALADVICTVSGADKPILLGDWVKPGTHVNLVGSSYLGPAEVDAALVARARYIADCRPSVLAQAAEFAVARDAGLVTDDHIVAEIGEVLAGRIAGRTSDSEITVYKSLGHVVQDLAATAYLHRRAAMQDAAS